MEIDYNRYYPHWIDEFKRCGPWLEAALEYSHGDHTLQDIADGLHQGRYMLWTSPTAAMITEFSYAPQQTSVHLFLAGGDMAGVEQLVEEVVDWAKENHCGAVTLTGRPGWRKSFLQPMGFTEVTVHMIKKLR